MGRTQPKPSDKFEIVAQPCTICGSRVDVEVDHIWPKSMGGPHDRFNLQPLCYVCNHRKQHRLTNVELRQIFESDPDAHWEQVNRHEQWQWDKMLRRVF